MDRVYLSSGSVIAVFDHEKKRTFVIRKEGLPDVGKYRLDDAKIVTRNLCNIVYTHTGRTTTTFLSLNCDHNHTVVWNPWEKKAKAIVDLGDEEYKQMLCVDGAAVERPIALKPGEEWTGRLELSVMPSI